MLVADRDPPARRGKILGVARRLVQQQRGAAHIGVIVEDGTVRALALTPGMGEPAAALAERLGDEGEAILGEIDPIGPIEAHAGGGEGGDHQPVPVGEDLVVQAGPDALLARAVEDGAAGGEFRLARRLAEFKMMEAIENDLAFPVAAGRDVVDP